MGYQAFDQYSLLHFSTGVVAYFLQIPFIVWFIMHLIFEIIENSESSMRFVRKYLNDYWPGGKEEADALINSMGDQFMAMAGWTVAYYVDQLGDKYGWYKKTYKNKNNLFDRTIGQMRLN